MHYSIPPAWAARASEAHRAAKAAADKFLRAAETNDVDLASKSLEALDKSFNALQKRDFLEASASARLHGPSRFSLQLPRPLGGKRRHLSQFDQRRSRAPRRITPLASIVHGTKCRVVQGRDRLEQARSANLWHVVVIGSRGSDLLRPP